MPSLPHCQVRLPYGARAALVVAAFAVYPVACNDAPRGAWLSGSLTPTYSPTSQAARYFVELVEARTDGRVAIEHYDTSQLGSGQQQIEALVLGTQQVYFGSGSAPSILVPAYGIIDVAFLFRDRAHFDRFLTSSMMDELNRRLFDRFGIRVLAMDWFRQPRYLLHRDRFITGPESIAGTRVRAPNLPMFLANWTNLGAVPVKIAFFEQYLALSQNLVDMTEASGDDIYPMRLHEVVPFITDAQMMFPQASAYVSEQAFQRLSPDDQRVVIHAAQDAGDLHARLVNKRFESDRRNILAEGGRFEVLPPEARDEFFDLVRRQMPQMEADGLVPPGWFERIQAMR